jgi:hypothetical protein
MTDNRKSGIALIAGSLGTVVTMAVHPTASASLSPEQVDHLMSHSGLVHSLAILSILALFLGACGLVRHIAAADRISFAALVTFALACIGIFIAATVSGFIVPSIMKHMAHDVPEAAPQWKIVIYGIFQINQAFASIYSVAASAAIILWSISALRNGGFGRGTAIYGCIISALIIVGVCVGHLRMDVHGMAAVALGQTIWFILVGSQLLTVPNALTLPNQKA